MTSWYEEWFGADYLALYPHRDLTEARDDVAAIVALLDPPKKGPLLDLCCGAGRHLVALQEAGFTDLTGIDLSPTLLDTARQRLGAGPGTRLRLLRSDMRDIPFRDAFDTVLSLFTSFGYFTRTADDLAVLREAHAALRVGGRFVLDTLNRPWTIAHLEPSSETTRDDLQAMITRSISPDGLRVEKQIRLRRANGEVRHHRESVRMYEAGELRSLLDRAGFTDIRILGGLDGRPYGPDAARMVGVARKPATGETT